jgi:type VI secretion system protein ImpF
MLDLTPVERLQPCLLDRLTDDEPDKKEESRTQRVISHQKYRRGVLRDLEWLLNTSAFVATLQFQGIGPEKYPEVWKSVLNFGTRQLTGVSSPDLEQLKRELGEAIATFEPRMFARTLTIRASADRNFIIFDVEGELWANPVPEHLHVKTTLDFETGQSLLGDATNG